MASHSVKKCVKTVWQYSRTVKKSARNFLGIEPDLIEDVCLIRFVHIHNITIPCLSISFHKNEFCTSDFLDSVVKNFVFFFRIYVQIILWSKLVEDEFEKR